MSHANAPFEVPFARSLCVVAILAFCIGTCGGALSVIAIDHVGPPHETKAEAAPAPDR